MLSIENRCHCFYRSWTTNEIAIQHESLNELQQRLLSPMDGNSVDLKGLLAIDKCVLLLAIHGVGVVEPKIRLQQESGVRGMTHSMQFVDQVFR